MRISYNGRIEACTHLKCSTFEFLEIEFLCDQTPVQESDDDPHDQRTVEEGHGGRLQRELCSLEPRLRRRVWAALQAYRGVRFLDQCFPLFWVFIYFLLCCDLLFL